MNALRVRNTEDGNPAVADGLASAHWRRMSAQLQKLWAWRKSAALEAALSGLEDYQLDDVGITRGEIPAYAKASPYAPQHVSAMVDGLAIAPEWVRPLSSARGELLKGCRVCTNVTVCERWLLTCEPAYGYRAFCPNVALLDRLPRRSGNSRTTVTDHGGQMTPISPLG